MTYILTTTIKRANGKRHIVCKDTNIDNLKRIAENINDKYQVSIYNTKWQLVENIK